MDAWGLLRESLDPDALDPASRRLLPLLWRNLSRLGIRDPVLASCRGVHRYHWSRNQILFRRGAAVLNALAAAGIETLLLKGAALVTEYYGDPGLRPMEDFDVAVPAAAAAQAVDVLERNGWVTPYPITTSFRRIKHAAPFTDANGVSCDLHWNVLEECAEASADLWRAAREIEFQGQRTRALSPADQLLHVSIHGGRWAPESNIRWVADSMVILRAGGVDWRRLADQAARHAFVLRMRDALGFLWTSMDGPIPAAVTRGLAERPVAGFERLERWILGRDPRLLGELLRYWCHHLRAQDGSLLPAVLTFPKYLQHAWGLYSLRDVPGGALARVRRRMDRVTPSPPARSPRF